MYIPPVTARVKQAMLQAEMARGNSFTNPAVEAELQTKPLVPVDPGLVDEAKMMQGENLIDSVNLKANAPEVGPETSETGNEADIGGFISGTLGNIFSDFANALLSRSDTDHSQDAASFMKSRGY